MCRVRAIAAGKPQAEVPGRDLDRLLGLGIALAVTKFYERAMYEVNAAVDQIINDANFTNHAFVQEMLNGKQVRGWTGTTQQPARPIDYDSFVGVLHLMFMYKVGSALNQTNLFDGSTKKNAVPFLSKMNNMRYVITSAAPSLQKHRPPAGLITWLDSEFDSHPCTTVNWWLANTALADRRGTKGREAVVGPSFVRDMLADNKMLPEWLFGGTQVGTPRSGNSLHSPDELPAEVSQASAGQKGAQFEYRWITARPDGNGLAAALQPVIDEVRQLNLKHVGPTRAGEITNEANAPRNEVVIDL